MNKNKCLAVRMEKKPLSAAVQLPSTVQLYLPMKKQIPDISIYFYRDIVRVLCPLLPQPFLFVCLHYYSVTVTRSVGEGTFIQCAFQMLSVSFAVCKNLHRGETLSLQWLVAGIGHTRRQLSTKNLEFIQNIKRPCQCLNLCSLMD